MSAETSLPEPRQIAVYRKYLQLQLIAEQRFSSSLAGKLVLAIGFSLDGAEMALATAIAGGTFLGIEPDAQHLKAAGRNKSCDFMVNTLDEALRVLKNEIRKRTPLSVGLLGSAAEILPVMVERGVQPNLIAGDHSLESPAQPVTLREAVRQLVERGADKLAADNQGGAEILPAEVHWSAANPQDFRRLDQLALETIPPEDWVRLRWLQHAAGYFHRQLPLQRVLSVREEERIKLLDAFRQAGSSAPFQQPATFRWLDRNRVLQITEI